MRAKKLDPNAIIPTKAHKTDAGFDLYALHDYLLYPNDPVLVNTGIALEIPSGCYGQICDRSSMGKKGIRVLGGIIDECYRGEVGVILINLNKKHAFQNIVAGNKIAQIVIQPYTQIDTIIEAEDLTNTERGEKAYGSSGT